MPYHPPRPTLAQPESLAIENGSIRLVGNEIQAHQVDPLKRGSHVQGIVDFRVTLSEQVHANRVDCPSGRIVDRTLNPRPA